MTDQINSLVSKAWELIQQAYLTRVWVALDYRSWDDYCAAEFDRARIRVPREERSEVVASLREIGMSTRAIAAATGLSQPTVSRELSGGDSNESPDSVVGLDGKSYSTKSNVPEQFSDHDPDELSDIGSADGRSTSAAHTSKRAPITKSFDAARRKLCSDAKTLARLIEDDRFDRYATQLAEQHLGDLWRARDALQAVLDRLPNPFDESREG
ncbi:hypothetical protein H0264_14550 [Nocardia huaxiensis]|uniref:Uncharacterized protein n=1 Tax=Nocardia huaxiensis TaxID=2755382 RepID=A0A7D6ZE06_9NOCA|nr:hypothetical protein [Nocardia huaxiensis]QLY33288.1 hypothetical protein H0264_14550 [Nocardia huaxiensis]